MLRKGTNWNAPGNYECFIVAEKTVINRGERLRVDVFFSGYGQIGGSKIYLKTSSKLFSPESFFKFNISQTKNGGYKWGERQEPLGETTTIAINFDGGLIDPETGLPTLYFDQIGRHFETTSVPLIMTEFGGPGEAPLSMEFIVLKGIKAGNHNVNFIYTYFNGTEWKGSNIQLNFTIQNYFQQYNGQILLLGLVAAIVGAITSIVGLFQH